MKKTLEKNKTNPILLVPMLGAPFPWAGGEAKTRNHSKEICRHTHQLLNETF